MTTIACQDMGISGCSFVAKGETFEEAASALKEHGMSAHAEEIKGLMDGGMTEDAMAAKMQEVAKTE